MLTEKSFDTGEIVINFAEGETAGPPLVMLHGSSLNWQSYEEFIPTLEQSWHIYACDLRGHGKSGRAKSGYLYEILSPIQHLLSSVRPVSRLCWPDFLWVVR